MPTNDIKKCPRVDLKNLRIIPLSEIGISHYQAWFDALLKFNPIAKIIVYIPVIQSIMFQGELISGYGREHGTSKTTTRLSATL